MTIEQKMLRQYGETDVAVFAQWMLSDGTMINGTVEGYQRDIDHRCVSEHFKRSKREDAGSASIYVKKFMNRGNIRMTCNQFGYCIEMRKMPTVQQFRRLREIMKEAEQMGLETYVEWHPRKSGRRHTDWDGFIEHLRRYDVSVLYYS